MLAAAAAVSSNSWKRVVQPVPNCWAISRCTVAGGIGHTLPYLIQDFVTATVLAGVVVVIELATIAWIQWKYMDTPPLSAAAKVMLGGALVLATGILIGSA